MLFCSRCLFVVVFFIAYFLLSILHRHSIAVSVVHSTHAFYIDNKVLNPHGLHTNTFLDATNLRQSKKHKKNIEKKHTKEHEYTRKMQNGRSISINVSMFVVLFQLFFTFVVFCMCVVAEKQTKIKEQRFNERRSFFSFSVVDGSNQNA